MATPSASPIPRGATTLSKISFLILVLTIVHSRGLLPLVECQDFEDLNTSRQAGHTGAGGQFSSPPNNAFQSSRQFAPVQAPSSSSSNQQFQAASNSRQSFQRPVLSNRFAQSAQQQQQQQLSGQASTISNTVVSGQQQTFPTTTSQQQQASPLPASSNIEQIMKNALARTSRLEQTNGNTAESRQDQNVETIQSRSGAQFQSSATPIGVQSSSIPPSLEARNKIPVAAEPAESQAGPQLAEDLDNKKTTVSQTDTTINHDTVYSDQRFANLFARRNNQKKTKFTPTEQIKAKPTLPSFIKSPPDPKQFNPNTVEGQDRPITQASASLVSVRLQQSNQNRQSANTPKKPAAVITSNTAASANNKRLNSQKPAASSSPKSSSAPRATGSQGATNAAIKPISNNPFNKSQQSSSDPANVIAMARRRLLANNAAQQQKPANS